MKILQPKTKQKKKSNKICDWIFIFCFLRLKRFQNKEKMSFSFRFPDGCMFCNSCWPFQPSLAFIFFPIDNKQSEACIASNLALSPLSFYILFTCFNVCFFIVALMCCAESENSAFFSHRISFVFSPTAHSIISHFDIWMGLQSG